MAHPTRVGDRIAAYEGLIQSAKKTTVAKIKDQYDYGTSVRERMDHYVRQIERARILV
jgi:chromatin segregation and condensation protein Rec8/ScpA/Scc1 (kleisin family)